MTVPSPIRLSRRILTRAHANLRRRDMLMALGGLSAAGLWACATDGTAERASSSGSSSSSGGHTAASSSGGAVSSAGGASSAAESSSGNASSSSTAAGSSSSRPAAEWAVGGTAILAGKDYGNPFSSGVGPACVVYPESTLGPCHATTVDRQDISEGEPGLPTRLEFLLLDNTCNPLPNATMEIWHCSVDGFYSGSDAVPLCTSNNPGAMAARYFRGIRTADAAGRITFDTCFPGWYPGRTVHIHFTVVNNGSVTRTSQLFFSDELKADIQLHHPTYAPRGVEDTRNATDGVIRQAGLTLADASMVATRQWDGALLAWKAIVVA